MFRYLATLLVVLACATIATPASADIIFSLDDVVFTDGGALTGTFTTTNDMTTVVSAELTATAVGPFAGFTYSYPGNVLNESLPTQYLQLDASGDELRLAFNHAILAGFVDDASYDDELGYTRTIAGGHVIEGVPEPSTVALLGAGLLALGMFTRCRQARRYFDHPSCRIQPI